MPACVSDFPKMCTTLLSARLARIMKHRFPSRERTCLRVVELLTSSTFPPGPNGG